MLARARDLYRTGGYGDPWDEGAVRVLAERIVSEIHAAHADMGYARAHQSGDGAPGAAGRHGRVWFEQPERCTVHAGSMSGLDST